MSTAYAHKSGFTLVELLIVIVVIGILTAISAVSYRGITNSAHDVAVKSDLTNFAKQAEIYYAQNGKYPVGGGVASAVGAPWDGDSNTLPNFSFKFSRQSYAYGATNGNSPNVIYCTGPVSGEDFFRIVAKSKSGTVFAYESSGGSVKVYPTGAYPEGGCLGISYPFTTAWGITGGGVWNGWTQ
jgi:general secretion pathway protein G